MKQPQAHFYKPRSGKAHPLTNTTPFPNGLFEFMPSLKDSEWRVLCLIVRQTWGWQDGDGRKRSDWLTQRQMMKRTGRSSEALSRAIDALVRRGLIGVRDEDGELLETPSQRRRCGGRLYFSVKSGADKNASANPETAAGESAARKSEEVSVETRSTDDRDKGNSPKTASRTGKSEVPGRKSEEVAGKSGVRKANTTKETGTKSIQKELVNRKEESLIFEVETSHPVPETDLTRFLRAYNELRKECASGHSPPLENHSDAALAHDLLGRYGFDRLMALLLRFLRGGANDHSPSYEDRSLRTFKAAINRLLVNETRERLLRPHIHTGWSRAGEQGTPRSSFHPPNPPQP